MSSRKNRSPEEQARRAKIRELLQESNISSMEDIRSLFKETIAEFMENGLDAELDDELGYSKYDYKNKDTNNSRNGHSSKTLRTSFGDVEVSVPRDRKGEFDPHEKVDCSAAGLEYDLCPIERFLRRPNPRIAETDPHVKGKMHGGRSRRP